MSELSINILTETQARQIIREELESFFRENLKHTIGNKEESKVVDLTGLLTARPFLGSRSTIYKKISNNLIPHSKEGKKLYFNLSEIDEWLMSNKVKTISELEEEYQLRKQK